MQWIQLILTTFAATGLVLAVVNCGYFARYARTTRSTSRRVGAISLAVINAGFASEAAAYLSFAPPVSGIELLVASLVRPLLLAATAFVSLLIWRQGGPRRL